MRAKQTKGRGPIAPPLKWAGGKRWQVPYLRPYWELNQHRRLVEPFCGGLAVTLGLMPESALLNDINPHLINFYNWVKKGLIINLAMKKSEARYYTYRKQFNHLLETSQGESIDTASLFYYLNRTGYNGLCRFNSSGEFNVPFGRYKRIGYVRNFSAYRRTLAAWEFLAGDFAAAPIAPDRFFYAHPPYRLELTTYAKVRIYLPGSSQPA